MTTVEHQEGCKEAGRRIEAMGCPKPDEMKCKVCGKGFYAPPPGTSWEEQDAHLAAHPEETMHTRFSQTDSDAMEFIHKGCLPADN